MPIDTKHPQYQKRATQWTKIRDAIEGQDEVKAKRTTYLPALSSQKESREGIEAYENYLARASLFGAVGRTRQGIVGAIMRKPPAAEGVADARAEMLKTIGVQRQSVDAVAADVLCETLIGRAGILVDAGEAGTDPYLAVFRAESIINWEQQDIDGRLTTTLVVVEQVVSVPDESDKYGLARKDVPQWILFRLGSPSSVPVGEGQSLPPAADNGMVYWQEEWRRNEGSGAESFALVRVTVPVKAGGRVWGEIPFAIVNAVTGIRADAEVPILLDLANLVYSHYLNSADDEWGMHWTAIPQPWAAGFDVQEGDSLVIGSGRAWVTPSADAKVGYLEFSGSGLGSIAEAMKRKEHLMAVTGSRLLEAQPTQAETMGAVRLRQSGDRSVVANVAANVSAAMTMAIRWALDWSSTEDASEATYTLSSDFDALPIDPAQLQALMAALQAGTLSWETFAWNLRRGEMLPPGVTDADERARIAAGAPGRDNVAELQLLQSDVREGRITQATYLQRCKDLGLYPAGMDVEAEVELTASGPEPEPDAAAEFEPDDEMPLDDAPPEDDTEEDDAA